MDNSQISTNPPKRLFEDHYMKPHLNSFEEYQDLYRESITEPDKFWAKQALELLSWTQKFQTVQSGSLADGDIRWFADGRLNASFNCVDRHALEDPSRIAIIFEANEVHEGRKITYGELLCDVSKTAWVLHHAGVCKGDIITIYMPMIPEVFIAILACARIGAVHSVVFAGLSASALADRINDAQSKVVITADESSQGDHTIQTKDTVDVALDKCSDVATVLVYRRTGNPDSSMTPHRDLCWHEELEKWPDYFPPVTMGAEDPLFILYTSGSTGKPKGLLHTTAGFLLGAAITGWITGHTYGLYAPLLLGISTVVFEGSPAYPDFSRYWDIIDQHRVTHLHTAPTTIRLLKRYGDDCIEQRMEHLRILGSVGEPIAPEVWRWYHGVVGKSKAHVVDTYFQTETGSNVMTPLGGITPTKPGSVTFPFFGIEPALLDPISGIEICNSDVEGVLVFRQAWPSMARTIYGAHQRFLDVYLRTYKGYYFTGDSAVRDQDGFYWIRGRVDDVVNISGHRLSTAEIESALLEHPAVAEAAVVGVPDEISGQAFNAFVTIRNEQSTTMLRKELIAQVHNNIGVFAAPKAVYVVSDLPKTRSGKIMRRILRKVLTGEEHQIGDTSTLVDPRIVARLTKEVWESKGKQRTAKSGKLPNDNN